MQGVAKPQSTPGWTPLAPSSLTRINPDIKWTLVAISEHTGMSVSQVTDEVLYTGLIKMQELDSPRK